MTYPIPALSRTFPRPKAGLRFERRLALALLLAGGVALAHGAEADSDNYFDPLPKSAPKAKKATPVKPKVEVGKAGPDLPPPPPPKAAAPEEDYFSLPDPGRSGSDRFLAAPGGDCGNVFADVAERVLPGVVSVTRKGKGRDGSGLGSGVLAGPKGLVLTNRHVVAGEGALRVRLADGRELDATLIASDAATDVAVLRIKAPKEEMDELKADLKPIPLGNSDAVRVGEWVVAIGSPYGLSETVTTGIVSAKNRRNTALSEYGSLIQTDAAINPGNSGGALVNLRGELIGINTAIVSRNGGSQGIGFAIPVNLARKVMEDLLRDGKVTRGWLGASVASAEGKTAGGTRVRRGARIESVTAEGPAAKAGLKKGDVIVSLEGKAVRDADDLMGLVSLARPGTVATVEYLRGGERREADVKLGKRALPSRQSLASAGKPEDRARADEEDEEESEEEAADTEDGPRLGMSVAKATSALRKRYGLEAEDAGALVVTGVEKGGGADDADLRAGDVIVEADKRKIATVEALRAAVAKGAKSGVVALTIRRDGETLKKRVRLYPGSA
jgi:serine protease Do